MQSAPLLSGQMLFGLPLEEGRGTIYIFPLAAKPKNIIYCIYIYISVRYEVNKNINR
jgi:hypothetical protein